MNKKGAILVAWLILLVSGNLVAAETQVAVSEQNGTSPPTISWSELEKRRPPDSFHMVYAEDKPVCKTILDALNEVGYDQRYFNSSPEIYHPLPELLLQTRLNMPRKLLGTHLFRTEEYEIPWVDEKGKPQKDYWYRFIGQGYSVFALATDIDESYYAHHTQMYTDYIDFRSTFFSRDILVWSRKTKALVPEFDFFDHNTKWDEISIAMNGQGENGVASQYPEKYWSDIGSHMYVFSELLTINNDYYLLETPVFPKKNNKVPIIAYSFNYMHSYMTWAYGGNKSRAICFIESNSILQGE